MSRITARSSRLNMVTSRPPVLEQSRESACTGGAGRGYPPGRTDAEPRRTVPDRCRWQGRRKYSGRGSTDAIAPIAPEDRRSIIQHSDLHCYYEKLLDRKSAYEKLKTRTEHLNIADNSARTPQGRHGTAKQPDSNAEKLAMSVARAAGSQLGRQLVRGVLGSLFGGRR